MVTLQFHGTENSFKNTYLEVHANGFEEITVKISISSDDFNFITLDKETAIKLAKELKKQISFI